MADPYNHRDDDHGNSAFLIGYLTISLSGFIMGLLVGWLIWR